MTKMEWNGVISGVAAFALVLAQGASVAADSVTLTPVKDNTLIEAINDLNSNAKGDGIFSGRTGPFAQARTLRAVLAFDVAGSIPPGSKITSATLTLTLLQTVSGDQTHGVHRLLADWGEGTSEYIGGMGVPATDNDATWLHTFYPDAFWTTPGGDFVATPSATQVVSQIAGPYTWASEQLTADVQFWLDNPGSNFGWIVLGNEATPQSAKKFGSREHKVEMTRPRLVIEFTPPAGCSGDITGDNVVNVADLLAVINAWGPCPECAADLNGDGMVNVSDLLGVINAWGSCP